MLWGYVDEYSPHITMKQFIDRFAAIVQPDFVCADVRYVGAAATRCSSTRMPVSRRGPTTT
ncbi:MAG: hypothetical protein HC927_13950 [Deltaproteobacteria bacterium]|nr:hypothetical protein [Deltaproteobacteria bacterium]